MSNFSEAVRQMQLAEVTCPACGAKNAPGKPPVIRIDVFNDAWCSLCGAEFEVKK